MDVFEEQYKTYRIVLSLIGLWPYHESLYRTIQRVAFCLILLCGAVIQVVSLLKSDITVERCILRLSISCPLLLFFTRYLYLVINFPLMKYIFEGIQTEVKTLQDPNEIEILIECIERSSYVIRIFMWVCFATNLFFTVLLLTPVTLDLIIPINGTQSRYVNYVSEILVEQTLYINAISILFLIDFAIGLLTMACTESMLGITAQYIYALFKIASYRIKKAIMNATNSNVSSNLSMSDFNDFRQTIDIHTRCISFTHFAANSTIISYLVTSLLAIISFALCLRRLLHAVTALNDPAEVLLSFLLVFTHLVIMFLNNYSGQVVVDGSANLFQESYDTTWYCMPLRAQKLLLFIMLRSSIECAFNLSGLFVPCHKGFSTMVSTSFSYFTLMCSMH